MRILIAGDTHGHADAIRRKARVAQSMGCTHMFIVGDFGVWPGYSGVEFLDDVNAAAREFNQQVVALPGNHEDHDQWDKWFDIAPLDSNRFAVVRSHVRLTKKVHPFRLGGKSFYVCGGAVSIDKQWRKAGVSWWENEEFSESDLASVEKYRGPRVDYLLTHDCSDYTEWGFNLKPDPDSKANRQRIDKAIKVLRPKFHFHGHMHTRYEWLNTRSHGMRNTAFGYDESEWNGVATKTYGLECDNENDSFVILDTGSQQDEGSKVYWPNEAHEEFSGFTLSDRFAT